MFIACTEPNLLYQIYYGYPSQIKSKQVTSIFRNICVYSKDKFNFSVYSIKYHICFNKIQKVMKDM